MIESLTDKKIKSILEEFRHLKPFDRIREVVKEAQLAKDLRDRPTLREIKDCLGCGGDGKYNPSEHTVAKGFPNKLVECPDSKRTWYASQTYCNLNDKPCTREAGWECPYYDEYLEELEEEGEE